MRLKQVRRLERRAISLKMIRKAERSTQDRQDTRDFLASLTDEELDALYEKQFPEDYAEDARFFSRA